ncbi:DNA polymerase I [Chlamydiales bacterium SCGC AG-110-M15]|nr:DNA polymerase I [Chlamydiales bacterium SCGC AG-110-M15]
MKTLYIIDGTGYLFRSYHAIRGMTDGKGQSTNALYGFIRSLQKLRKDFSPEHLIVVFDGPGNSDSRKKIYADYKANRGDTPEDLLPQLGWAREYCVKANIPSLTTSGYEADDAMGSIAKWAEGEGAKVFICSSDKDLCQLVDDQVHILNTYKDNLVLDPSLVESTFGVPPSRIVDLLALAGDASDNVPGVSGIGMKTAAKFLNEFGSLDSLLEAPDKVPGKKKQEALTNEAEMARLSRELVTLDTSTPFEKDPEFFTLKEPEIDPLKEFYQLYNFKTLVKELNGVDRKEEPSQGNYHLVDDESSLSKLAETLSQAKLICFDTETTHINAIKAELVGVGFAISEGEAWYVPVNGNLGLDKVVHAIRPLFENEKLSFFGHNVKYDLHVLQNYSIHVRNISFDTILASYILNSHNHRHSLDHLCMEYFDKQKIPTKSLLGTGKKAVTMDQVPIPQVSEYCCEDVDYTFRLHGLLEPQIRERKLERLFYEMELPLLRVLAKMERRGVYLDVPVLEKFSAKLSIIISDLEKVIYDLAGEEFNINSPKQLGEILFGKLGIPPTKKKDTGPSTDASVLESLKERYPIAEHLLSYRHLKKLQSTYADTLPLEVYEKTGRIHCSFQQFVAATGRLSCNDPNLQNIPVRTPEGQEIRAAFRPERSGWSFLAADYSQIELRLLAHMSGDPNLIDAFKHGKDIHTHTASLVFGVSEDEVTKEQRYQSKAVNFGIIYGQQAFGLSRELGISMKEASEFIRKYFERYPSVAKYMENCREKARKTGRAVTLTGRERLIPDMESKNPAIRGAAERLAINTPLQGTAADLIKIAMLRVEELLKRENKLGYLILQVHDELIFEVPDFELLDFEPLVRESMEKVFKLKVPLLVDINVGKNWKEC